MGGGAYGVETRGEFSVAEPVWAVGIPKTEERERGRERPLCSVRLLFCFAGNDGFDPCLIFCILIFSPSLEILSITLLLKLKKIKEN